jgi:cell wall-associated NlpC family hydrolase
MMRKFFYLLVCLSLSGCFVKKNTTYSKTKTVTVEPSDEKVAEVNTFKSGTSNPKADSVISTAMKYTGVRYKFGGTTKKGMDCSGLIYVALLDNEINFPRVSHRMADQGKRVLVEMVERGDLLFFRTKKGGKRINHVGLVVNVQENEIKFIHATSSRGVIVSSLREGYWNQSFVKATRIL